MGFDYYFDSMGDWQGTFFLTYMLCCYGFAIASYVLRSLGFYTIAKRRGINHPWMSWVPVLNSWVLGCISDQYQYVVKGKTRNKRKWLLGLNIAMWVVYVAYFVLLGVLIASTIAGFAPGMGEARLVEAMMGKIFGMLAGFLIWIGIAIAVAVIRYIAMYDLYTSCTPENNVLFLVLSIVFNVTEPFFVFFIRKKDDGMPPRREPQPQTFIPEISPEEPWENE